MSSKFTRKFIALRDETIKRLPYVFVLLGLLLLVQGYQNATAARQNTEATRNLVARQDDILRAIAKSTEDGNATAKQQTAIIICMLQVPISQRSTDLLNNCRKQVEAAKDTNDIILPSPIDASQDPSINETSPSQEKRSQAPTELQKQPQQGNKDDSLKVTGGLEIKSQAVCVLLAIVC